MAASTTPRPKPDRSGPPVRTKPFGDAQDRLVEALAQSTGAPPLAVALSGGADSTALLVAAARHWPGQVAAIHIHHGLQAAADHFERHCRTLCESLGVPLTVLRIDARHAPGDSPEDAARTGRYAALAAVARERSMSCVLLAQHADDQVETLLLALSRGAGLPGLAAMPQRFEREGMVFVRPLLKVPGSDLRGYLRHAGVAWIEDPSNADIRFTRNRIRLQLLPALEAAFPGFRETFARSSRHAAQAQQLLSELAAQDLTAMQGVADIAALRALSRERRANVLRHWLREHHRCAANAAQLEELLDQIDACRTRGHRIRMKVADGFVTRDGDRLTWAPTL